MFSVCNCTEGEKDVIEEINRKAIRIITGAKKGTSHELLYQECDLEPIHVRRKNHMILMLHKILNCTKEGQLNCSHIKKVSSRNPYVVRNFENLCLKKCNTELYRESFLPNVIRIWNELDDVMQQIDDEFKLKWKLKNIWKVNPMYDLEVTRLSGIHMTRLRCQNSNLKKTLYERLMSDTSSCECGEENESDSHYFLNCVLYNNCREQVVSKIPLECWNLETIYHGSDRYENDLNLLIAKTAQEYVTDTKRFN